MPSQPQRSAKPVDVLSRAGKLSPPVSRGRGRHSTLYVWMRQHHGALASAFAENAPNWTGMAASMAEAGLRDADGKPPTPEGARQTWWRVRKAAEANRAKAKGKTAPPVLPAETPATKPASHAAPVPCPPVLPVDQKRASPSQGSRTAAEKIQSAFASLRAREVPLPERINPKPKDR